MPPCALHRNHLDITCRVSNHDRRRHRLLTLQPATWTRCYTPESSCSGRRPPQAPVGCSSSRTATSSSSSSSVARAICRSAWGAAAELARPRHLRPSSAGLPPPLACNASPLRQHWRHTLLRPGMQTRAVAPPSEQPRSRRHLSQRHRSRRCHRTRRRRRYTTLWGTGRPPIQPHSQPCGVMRQQAHRLPALPSHAAPAARHPLAGIRSAHSWPWPRGLPPLLALPLLVPPAPSPLSPARLPPAPPLLPVGLPPVERMLSSPQCSA